MNTTTSSTSTQPGGTPRARSVLVYQIPVRIWHWTNALAILVLACTGYFIGQPLPSMPGEASDYFVMGYIRFVHFAAAYVFAIGMLARIYWAFVGNAHAHELFVLPIFTGSFWTGMAAKAASYLFIRAPQTDYVGHNPLARAGMFVFTFLLAVFMIFSGFALYSEGAGVGSWQDLLFGWMIPLFGGSLTLHSVHRMGMWLMVMFVIMHIYLVVHEDITGRQSIISTMISGLRTFKD